jgi:membrane-bound metal-dependent hydrolase YbcI (DUF457 family)
VETYAHAFYTWAIAKHGVGAGRAAGVAGAVGGSLPDMPSIAATAYYIGPRFLSGGWSAMDSKEVLDAIYFTGPFGSTGSALHSLVPPALLLGLYAALRLGRRDARGILLWFLIGWAGHTVVDFLTHAEDTRPLFWPLSGWEWSSPVSYWDPDHYGRIFFLVNHVVLLLTISLLFVRRLRRKAV